MVLQLKLIKKHFLLKWYFSYESHINPTRSIKQYYSSTKLISTLSYQPWKKNNVSMIKIKAHKRKI